MNNHAEVTKSKNERMTSNMAKRGENIYKRKDGRWEARVIKGHDVSGKALYAYFYGRSYKEVKDKIFAPVSFVADNPTIVSATPEDTTRFEEILQLWLERKKLGLKESSYVKYFNLINNHIKPSLGDYPLTCINSAMLNSFIAEKYKTGKLNSTNGLSVKTLKDIMTVIKAVLRFAKDEGLLSDGASVSVTFPREKPKEMRVLSKDEQLALEKHLCNDMNLSKLGILICLYTGLRIGEICSLRWGNVSLEKRTLTVSDTMQRVQTLDSSDTAKTKVIVDEPKSDCSLRTIPIPDCLIDKLEMFRQANPSAYLLTGEVGCYIEPRTYQNHFKAHILAVGIKDANFHSTRHTFATRCIEVGFEIKSLSEILGHANVNITLNRYVHPSFDLKRSNMNKLTLN